MTRLLEYDHCGTISRHSIGRELRGISITGCITENTEGPRTFSAFLRGRQI